MREQRDGDAGEPVAGRKTADEPVDEPERMETARQAADQPRCDHHGDEHAGGLDADRARKDRVLADEPGAEPSDREPRPDAIENDKQDADDESEMQRRRRQETGKLGVGRDQFGRGIRRAAREQRAVDEPACDADGDEVEHQRRHDFVDAKARAQDPGSPKPESACDCGRGEGGEDDDRGRPVRRGIADDGRSEPAEIKASLGADVENAGAERHRRGEAGQKQRRRGGESGGDAALAANGFLPHKPVGVDRVEASGEKDRGADRESERERRRGVERPDDAGAKRARHAAALRPSIMRPTVSTLASDLGMSPTMRPLNRHTIRSDSVKSSSSASETSSTAPASVRKVAMRLWMKAVPAMSTPRVGWEATRNFGARASSRAMARRCWLPPERLPAGSPSPP